MMLCFQLCYYLLLSLDLVTSKHNITIFAISNLDDNGYTGASAVGAQWLAIQEINNNSKLLPNFTLDLQVFNVYGDSQLAVIEALDIIQHKSTKNHTYLPMILGCPWSALSTATALVLGAFDIGQISSAATSIVLSDTSKYPYFYRTVPSDTLQAEGVILLCRTFNWTSIVIVYVNDAYGLHLSLGIQELANIHGIEAASIAITYESDDTYNYAARQIKDLKVYIIVLVIHSTARLFSDFRTEGIVGYPYFYIGVDGWFDKLTLKGWNATSEAQGFIGTTPWQPPLIDSINGIDLEFYDENIRDVVNVSMHKKNVLEHKWSYYYNNGYEDELYIPVPGDQMIYGYDAMYTLLYVMRYIQDDLVELAMNNSKMNKILNDIITNNIDFTGASGHVIFDGNGDRIDGLLSFANSLEDGTVDYFGYFYRNKSGSIIYKFNQSKIIWPKYFTERGIIPRSNILIHEEIVTINHMLFVSMFVLLVISMIIAIIFVLFLLFYRKKTIIKAAAYKLNIVMCIGGILAYIACILFGIDEFEMNESLYILCNFRIWILCIAYSLLFMPLFLKTYRLSLLFKIILDNKILNEKGLFIRMFVCIMIDIIILAIFTIISPLQRGYEYGPIESMDELQQIQYIYGDCVWNESNSYPLYITLIIWKSCQLMFGLYVGLSVSRIDDTTNFLTKFDETGIQLLSIFIVFIIICITIPMFVFGPIKKPNFAYSVISISIIFVGNIVLFLNLSPRIIAILTKNEKKYTLSIDDRLKERIKAQLHKFSTFHQQTRNHIIQQQDIENVELTENEMAGIKKDTSDKP